MHNEPLRVSYHDQLSRLNSSCLDFLFHRTSFLSSSSLNRKSRTRVDERKKTTKAARWGSLTASAPTDRSDIAAADISVSPKSAPRRWNAVKELKSDRNVVKAGRQV